VIIEPMRHDMTVTKKSSKINQIDFKICSIRRGLNTDKIPGRYSAKDKFSRQSAPANGRAADRLHSTAKSKTSPAIFTAV